MLPNTDITLNEPQAEAFELEAETGARPVEPAEQKASVTGHIARAAVVLMVGTVFSRVLGLGRETTIATLFGAKAQVDAFTVANNVSTIVYDLLIAGTVSAALVPVFSEYAADKEHRGEFSRVVSTILTVAGLFLIFSILVLEVFAEPLVSFMGPDFSPEGHALALVMTQWVLPGVLFLGLSGVVMAAHYSLNRFVYPAFTSVLYNAAIIVCALTLGASLGVKSLALGLVVGAVAMLALQAPGLRDIPLRPTLDLAHPAVRKIFKLYAPVGLSVVVTSAVLILDRNLASQTGEGSISAMRYATTLVQFALGIVAATISLASLPSLSQHFSRGDIEAYKRTLAAGLRLVLVLVLPAAASLLALAGPIVGLVFRHGVFSADDQSRTALALLFYAPGLPFYAIDQVLIFAFYARKNTLTPVLVGLAQIGVYLVVALSTYKTIGMPGLVIANSAQLTFHALVMAALLWRLMRKEGGFRGYGIVDTIIKAGGASVATAVAAFGVLQIMEGIVQPDSLVDKVVLLGVPAAVGGLLYLGLIWAMRLPELQLVASKVTSRLRR